MTDTNPIAAVPRQMPPARWRSWRLRFRLLRSLVLMRDIARLAVFGLLLLALTVGSVAIDWGSGDLGIRAGDAADRTIKSTEELTFESELRTEDRRQEAYADARNVVLTQDHDVRMEQLSQAQDMLTQVATLREDRSRPVADRISDVRAILEDLSAAEAEGLLQINAASWELVRAEAVRLLDVTLANPLQQDAVARVKEGLDQRVSSQLSPEEQALAVAVARPLVRPNVFENEDETQKNRERAAAEVDPVTVTVLAGQAVIRDGDIVTRYDIEKLERLGLLTSGMDAATRLGRSGIMAMLTLVLLVYLLRFQRPVWRGRLLLLVAIALILPLVLGRLILPHPEMQYMFPIAASAMLLTLLLELPIAIVVSAVLAMYLGVISGMSFELVVLYFLSALVGAFVIWRAERTITFVWAGLAVGATAFVVAVCFNALETEIHSGRSAELLVETLVGGALSASLTFLSFSLLGSLLGVTTHLQLLELSRPNQPLLYRLAREAPGTYHHSIVVSNLAETGVEIVGGDPLFTRVAVLYHDVGKIVRPTFFIENQANLENPHDLLDPRVSARVIVDHVTDGARLARKARLPEPMVDIIVQHHGTSLIRYFYARSLESGDDVSEDEFRYPGPKPQTKEAGVIMLADSVEAAARATAMAGRLVGSRGEPREDADTLDAIVNRVVQERLDDGQLNECDLTLREIELIRRAFVQILEGIYHPRIEYPKLPTARPAVASVSSVTG